MNDTNEEMILLISTSMNEEMKLLWTPFWLRIDKSMKLLSYNYK